MQQIIALQKTGWYVTGADGDLYTEHGRMYFAKDIARDIARRIDGMYHPAGRHSTVKEVVTGYQENGQ